MLKWRFPLRPMFTLVALRALYSRKKTFRVVENRCLQYAESIFVNLPQFAKFGLKESLNRFFWYFSLHLFGYFGLVSSLFLSVSVCFTAALSMAAPSKRTDRVDGGRRSTFVSVQKKKKKGKLNKKNSCMPINPEKYSYKEYDNEKQFLRLEISLPHPP